MTHRKLFSISLAILTLAAATFFIGCEEEKTAPATEQEKAPAKESAPAPQPKAAKPAPVPTPTPTPAPKPIASLVTVKLQTTMGDIVLELNKTAAPITVENFLTYTRQGTYNGTIFHRVIPNFMIQGGGFVENMTKKPVNAPIVNEASNGLKNLRGTIAMARTSNPNSATNQFFINHKDNFNLDYRGANSPGYAVFGKVVSGMSVVDAIAAVPTATRGRMGNVPVEPIIIKSATRLR
ncbi:MAG TPA: peptidyl-prolyl cis-trans isomerase [Phycisphaerales bacterium]|nr:peptidyl-prolyl cis-trans isomerase [Phycisphaerales bacterium]